MSKSCKVILARHLNGAGLLDLPETTSVNLPPDSENNTSLITYNNAQLALFLLKQIIDLKTKNNKLGSTTCFIILGPERVLAHFEYMNIVNATSYKKITADILSSDSIIWGYDDAFIEKGSNGSDAVVLAITETSHIIGELPITTEFGKVLNGSAVFILNMPYQ